jgi:hypothetical protein
MLTGDAAFQQCYNAQAVVDEMHQVIEATDVNTNAADVGNLMPMTEQAVTHTGQGPDQVLARANPQVRERQATNGPQGIHPPQSHRRTGLRPDGCRPLGRRR